MKRRARILSVIWMVVAFDGVVFSGCPRPGPENQLVGGGGAGATTSASTSTSTGTGGTGGSDGGACPQRVAPSPDAGACPPATPLYTTTHDLSGLALLGDYVYFGIFYDMTNTAVDHVRYDGADVGPFNKTEGNGTTYLTSDGQQIVLWTNISYQKLYAQSTSGAGDYTVADWTPLTDAHNQGGNMYIGADGMFVAGGTVYWTTDYPPAVYRAAIDGSQQMTFQTVATTGNSPGGVVVDPDAVYWVDGTDIFYEKLADVDAGSFQQFASGASFQSPLAIDTERVYWITDQGSTHVQSLPKISPKGTPLDYGGSNATAIAVDPGSTGYVYWATPEGGVQASGKSGGPPLVLACDRTTMGTSPGSDNPVAIAVDCGAVYWTAPHGTAPDGGNVPFAVLKTAKPSP